MGIDIRGEDCNRALLTDLLVLVAGEDVKDWKSKSTALLSQTPGRI